MKILPFDPGCAADWLRLLNLSRPTPLTPAAFAQRDALWPPEDIRRRWLGVVDDRVVTIGQIAAAPYAPPDHLAALIVTDPARRRTGHGSAMLARLEAETLTLGHAALTGTIPEGADAALRWAEGRGFRRHATRFDSVLDLTGDQPPRVMPDAPPGIDFGDMTGADDRNWSLLFETFRTLLADAPDMSGLPPWTHARCRAVLRDAPGARPEWIILARSAGRPVGLTVGQAMGADIYSFFTGVHAAWRGRGLGRALKLRLIAAARRDGARAMRTTNLDCNLPALRLNAALGFRPTPGSIELRKRLGQPGRD